MGLRKSLDSSFYEAFIEELIIVEINGERIGFRTPEAASAAFCALAEGIGIDYIYSGVSGINFKISSKSCTVEQKRDRILMEPDLENLDLEGRTYLFTCDHNIIEHDGLCGISKCYESTIINKDDFLDDGWFCFNPEDGCKHFSVYDLENEDPTLHVCCPTCAERIVKDHEVDVLSRGEVWEARQFELDFIERQKDE